MKLLIDSAAGQIDGKRDYQEDFFAVYDKVVLSAYKHCTLAILCDGMGGQAAGQIASRLACETFYSVFSDSAEMELKERLASSLNAANSAIKADSLKNPEHNGMGTTLVAAVIIDNLLHWISVGDSPLWLRRKNHLVRLNADHSLAPVIDKLAEMGEITDEQAKNDNRRTQLRSALMGEVIEHIDLPDESIILSDGDDIILASDGVETIGTEKLNRKLKHRGFRTQQQRVQSLLQQITQKGALHQDNTTIIILHCASEKSKHESLYTQVSSWLGRKS